MVLHVYNQIYIKFSKILCGSWGTTVCYKYTPYAL